MKKTPTKTPVPKDLSAEAANFYRMTVEQYAIVDDEPALETLRQAARALMLIRKAEALLQAEGLVVTNRWKESRPHPATKVLTDARNSYLGCMRLCAFSGEAPPGR